MNISQNGTGGQPSQGYILNGTTVLPLGSNPVPPRRDPAGAKKVRRRIRRRFAWMLFLPIILGGVIVLSSLIFLPSTRDIEINATSGIVAIDGEDVAIVTYQDSSRPGLFEPTFQVRVAAVRLSDGTQLWDQRLNDDLIGDAVVLAGDAQWIYIGTDHGLVILDAASGAVQSQGTGVAGVGADAVLAASAYGYDQETQLIVLLSGTGQILQMPRGETVAVPADATVAARWQSTLSASSFYDDTTLTRNVEEAIGSDGTRYAVESVAEAVQRDVLAITPTSGDGVRGAEFVDAAILPEASGAPLLGTMLPTGQFIEGLFGDGDLDEAGIDELMQQLLSGAIEIPPTPAGLANGYVLVQHRASINAEGMQLSAVDALTGQVVSTTEMQTDALRALTGPGGTTAVIAAAPESWQPNRLLVLDQDGSFRVAEIGRLPWWLSPFG